MFRDCAYASALGCVAAPFNLNYLKGDVVIRSFKLCCMMAISGYSCEEANGWLHVRQIRGISFWEALRRRLI